MRRVGHEAAHLLEGPLDRYRGLPREERAAADNERERGQRRDGEDGDQQRVAVLELHAVRHRHRDVPVPVGELEPLGVHLDRAVLALLAEYSVHHTVARRLPRHRAQPVVRRIGANEVPGAVEEVEAAVGDVQLVHGVHHRAARLPRLHLPHARRADQLQRRAPHRRVQLPVDLPRDGGEEADAEDEEDDGERPRVPGGEAEPQPGEGVPHAPNR